MAMTFSQIVDEYISISLRLRHQIGQVDPRMMERRNQLAMAIDIIVPGHYELNDRGGVARIDLPGYGHQT